VRALAIVIALALGSAAAADPQARDPLDEAKALQASLDYEHALVIVDREIARGGANESRLVALELLAGTLAAGLDHPDVAQAHFARVLALAPALRLVDGTSPKITAPFEAARAASVPLHVELAQLGDRVVVTVGADPAHLVAGLALQLAPEPGLPDDVTAPSRELAVPIGRRALWAAALDEHGNRLAELQLRDVPLPAPAPATPIYARWSVWAMATGGVLAVAGACAWRFGVAQNEWNDLERDGGHDYSELAAVEARGQDWALAADVGVGLAAAAGVTALVMFALHREPATVPHVAATGQAVGFAIAF
jgi:hypothetical protein